MGNTDTKLNFRKAVIELTTKKQLIEANNQAFWEQFWSDHVSCLQDVFKLIPAPEIRDLREKSPSSFGTLCYKTVEKLVNVAQAGYPSQQEQQKGLNCVRLLTCILPYIFEDPDWRGFFWSVLSRQRQHEGSDLSLGQSVITAVCDLLFCPNFTVAPLRKSGPRNLEHKNSVDSCDYIWEAGIGCTSSLPACTLHDMNRTELLRLLLTCFSESMYLPPVTDAHMLPSQWIRLFTSTENRHALPLFTSLLNCVCSYDPSGYGVPYNHVMFTDSREQLVEVALQILCVTMETDTSTKTASLDRTRGATADQTGWSVGSDNLFLIYLSRIHREEDFTFILKGITRLLNNPLQETYLPGSCKKIKFCQELLVLFWKMCDINKKFMFFVLKSSAVLDIVVPVLYNLNDARADQSRVGLMHVGVFILLLLSGERNFGVRLNKPYLARVPMDIPIFAGSHADFLIIVLHKIIITGYQRLQPLFDCLLTIIVNVSPYLKSVSIVASTKLLHLLEAFSTPWFLYANATNYHLVIILLEVFNNIIQYQFDGNANLAYTIIRKRNVFHHLANLSADHLATAKHGKKFGAQSQDRHDLETMEESTPALEAETGTLKVSLAATPALETETGTLKVSLAATPALEAETGTLKVSLAATPALEAETGTLKVSLAATPKLVNMIETSTPDGNHQKPTLKELAEMARSQKRIQTHETQALIDEKRAITDTAESQGSSSMIDESSSDLIEPNNNNLPFPVLSPTTLELATTVSSETSHTHNSAKLDTVPGPWRVTPEWVTSLKQKLPLQTIMRLLQVLVPQVEKMCIDKGLTDDTEILQFLQQGTLVGLLPVPHPILIRKYQANTGTTMWFRSYLWGIIYLRNVDPPIWHDTNIKLFEIQRV